MLIPLAGLVFKSADLGWSGFWEAVASPRALAAYRLTFGAAFVAAAVNVVFGLVTAWVLARYDFPGKGFVDALVDLPFALPTAVAGHRADRALRGERVAGALPRAARDQGRVRARGRDRRDDLRRACRSSCAPCSRCCWRSTSRWRRRRRRWARRAGPPCRRVILPAVIAPRADRPGAGVRARRRRVRIDRLHLRQHADEDRDRAAADRHQAGAVRLRGRDGAGAGDAGGVVRHADGHQHPAGLDSPARRQRTGRRPADDRAA